jgi:hypothetical protein
MELFYTKKNIFKILCTVILSFVTKKDQKKIWPISWINYWANIMENLTRYIKTQAKEGNIINFN